MHYGLLIGLTRARVALLIAGLCWFTGLTVPAPLRLILAALVLVALAFDGAIDDQRSRAPAPAPPDDYRTAA